MASNRIKEEIDIEEEIMTAFTHILTSEIDEEILRNLSSAYRTPIPRMP